jgi:hypothetical protein
MDSFNTPLWNHFSGFDPLAGGAIGLIFIMMILFLFIYPSQRNSKNAMEKTFYLMLPPILFSMIVSYFIQSSLLAGITLILVYLVHLKFTAKLKNYTILIISLQLTGLFILFSILDSTLKLIIMLIMLLKFFFESETKKEKK